MWKLVGLVLALLGHHTESSFNLYPDRSTLSLEEVVPLGPDFYPERLTVQWISDNEYVFSEPNTGIQKYNVDADTASVVLDAAALANLSRYSVSSFSKDMGYLLLTANKRKVYRYSSIAEYFVYDVNGKRSVEPLAQGPLQVVVWGSGRSLAYVKDNNVYYVHDCSNPDVVTVLTNDGIPGQVYHGAADWIYEEEVFQNAEALWFSPQGTYLAVATFDDTLVDSAVYPFYGHPADLNFQYPHEIRFKYPKAGRTNPIAGLRVFKPDVPSVDAWNIPAPVDVIGTDNILARVNWVTDTNLLVLWMNRRQSISVLMNCDLLKDKCMLVRQRTEPNGWIDISEPLFAKDGTQMIDIEPQFSGGQRFFHAIKFDLITQKVEDLTPGNSTVTEILSWNAEEETLYYIVSPESQPWQRQLWRAKGGEQKYISYQESSCHSVTAMMSLNSSYGVLTCCASNVPPKSFLYNAKTNTMNLIKDNTKLYDKLSHYQMPMLLFNKFSLGPAASNAQAHVKLLMPPVIKKGTKYPMIVRVYAGPGTTRVKDNYDLDYYNSYLATNRSYVVASIDVRGSGVMDVDSLFALNNALGTVEITDTLEAIRQLVKMYAFIDPKKIGVWGWSYGGFATTMMLISDTHKNIACGAAVAPVTSWLYYDSIYTERYMDTPTNNPTGYRHADLMGSAEKLRGRKYLLVHGTGDDNVHYQNSLQLAKILQHSDIAFEQLSYTDETHSLLGVSRHFYHALDHFWTECFNS